MFLRQTALVYRMLQKEKKKQERMFSEFDRSEDGSLIGCR